MTLRMLAAQALHGLWRQKVRTALTLVGVTVGRDPATHKGYAIPAATVRAFLLRPRLRELHPPLAAKLTPPADPAPAADAPAEADGLPATIEIDGKTYTRVPGTREYVREGEAPAMR